MAIILKANKEVNLFVSSVFVCFLVPFTKLFRHTMYIHAPISTDSVSAVYRSPPQNLKIKEINGSLVSKYVPSENWP
jgi:hypothetical protein